MVRLSDERQRVVIDLLRQGHGPMEASRRSGVSKSYCYRLHHRLGGVYRPVTVEYSDRYLSREERYEIARLADQEMSLREIGRRLGRSASTISRELARNADQRTGGYQPERAHTMAWQRQRRPKPSKISTNPALKVEVQALLDKRLSPDQVSGRLKLLHPNNRQMQISHDTIYQSLYVYPRGELKRELKAFLRSKRTVRKRRGAPTSRPGAIIDPVSIHDRPEEIESRLIPGHHEGDLIKGTIASQSAVGTIVERSTGYLTLLHLPDGYQADKVAEAVITQMKALPDWFAKTLTWDRGSELARHSKITNAGIKVYFADPHSPWQRGSNENINGLLRQYMPKGTDLSIHTSQDLVAIADELNDRPRKRLGYYTPREKYAQLLNDQLNGVATTP